MHQPSFWWGGCLIAMVSGRDVLPVAVQATVGRLAEAGLSPGTTSSDLQGPRGYRRIVILMLISAWLSYHVIDTKPREEQYQQAIKITQLNSNKSFSLAPIAGYNGGNIPFFRLDIQSQRCEHSSQPQLD